MAEDSDLERTEEATPKRIEKAREEGQITYSKDLATAAVFIGIIVFLRFIVPKLYENLTRLVVFYLSLPNLGDVADFKDPFLNLFIEGKDFFLFLALLLLAAFAIAVMTVVIAGVFGVMNTVPAVRFIDAVREVVIAVATGCLGALAALGYAPVVSAERFRYATLGLALIADFLRWRP